MNQKNLHTNSKLRVFAYFVKEGAFRALSSPLLALRYAVGLVLYGLLAFVAIRNLPRGVFTSMLRDLWTLAAVLFGIIVAIGALAIIGIPKNFIPIMRDMARAGVYNSALEIPLLVKNELYGDKKDMIKLTFMTHGVDLAAFEDAKEKIESALNMAISSIDVGDNYRFIVIVGLPGAGGLPSLVEWNTSYLDSSESVINLGIGVAGLVSVDLAVTPHGLFAGSTGSGKSVQIKLALAQLLTKGHEVFLADFKGGIDYPGKWRELCNLVTDEDECLTRLQSITNELARRQSLLLSVPAPNIRAYNHITGEHFPCIIFAVDELAELTSTTGRSTEDKRRIEKIVGALSTIARLGRALGIHLILGLQRPDATALPGQIKNNIDFRACGRADNVLSVMVLDNGDAADKISKLNVGRFLTADGELYQGFYFDDSMLDGMICN